MFLVLVASGSSERTTRQPAELTTQGRTWHTWQWSPLKQCTDKQANLSGKRAAIPALSGRQGSNQSREFQIVQLHCSWVPPWMQDSHLHHRKR